MKTFRVRTTLAWMLSLATLGCMQQRALGQGEPQGAAAASHTDGAAGFPNAAAATPHPWVLFKVERELGAVCLDRDQSHGASPEQLLHDAYCRGPAPAHMARALLAIPQEALAESPDTRMTDLRSAIYLAAPGLGRRPDFTLVAGGVTIRSFESPDPQKTVYLVWPVKCGASDASMDCRSGKGRKAYRLGADGVAHDVSAQVLPCDPQLSAEDRARQENHGGSELFLFDDKLPYAPTMRWLMEFDPDQPLAADDPRRAGGYAHFGFVRWTGERFDRVDHVTRSQWPCRQALPGKPECSEYPDDVEDRFVAK
ncbi:hypothetical protein NG827_15655 [Xanthomonas sacchari]|nr:hypothetical protein [Xanthomonas sacchari]UYK83885.1 hypothetical protein NG827_15655 [Xanthomonas sacchari]